MQTQAFLLIVAAPSGGGKTSLVKTLRDSLENIELSISYTTRDKRIGEEHGKDYFFVCEDEFKTMIENKEFIEYAQVFGNYYGTAISQIKHRLNHGIDVVLDIDWQGAQQIRQLFTNNISVFILPPSLEELKNRLCTRKRDIDAIIEDRMLKAKSEMEHYQDFDYIIINDDFNKAASELRSIVVANRLMAQRQIVRQKKLLSLLQISK